MKQVFVYKFLWCVCFLLPLQVWAAASGAPGNPHLRNNATGGGNYTLHMTMWWGNNGTSWQILENGTPIYTGSLTDNSPNQQDAEYQITGKPNGTYVYTCKLINSFGSTACSDPTTVIVTSGGNTTVDTAAPSTPTQLAVSAKTSTSISLVWSASTDDIGVTGYDVSYGNKIISVTAPSATIQGLAANTTYTFTVKAKDAAGNNSSASAPLSVITNNVSTPDTTPPTTPAQLASPAQTDSSITLSWNPSTDNVGVTQYVVTYAFGTTTMTVTDTTAMITGLQPDTAYTFTVKAKDAAGNSSADSASLQIKTKAISKDVKATGKPGFPSARHNNWSGEPNYTVQMTMWWGNNGSSWEVYENGNLVHSAPLTDNSPNQQDAFYEVINKPNGVYEYQVKLINQFGSSVSDTMRITVSKGVAGDTVAPTVPTNLISTGKTSTSVSLSWGAATDNIAVTGYVISGGPAPVTVTATQATISGLVANTAYQFTVRAKDAAGNLSNPTPPVSVTTSPTIVDNIPPSTPTNVSIASVTSSSISLMWSAATDNVGVTGYVIYFGGSSANSAGTNTTINNLASNTRYTFTVKAIDANGNLSAASQSVSATTDPFDGVEPQQLLFDDFSYQSPDDDEFKEHWKASDYSPAAPGVGSYAKDNVVFFADPNNTANTNMRIMFKTKGAREDTLQGEVEGEKRFLYGTYASRIKFYNQPIEGPAQIVGPDTGDRMIMTFFTISPYYVPNTEYGELDFEYLPNAGWNPDEGGRLQGPTMWNTTWKDRWTRITKYTPMDASAWHTYWMTVTPTAVTYYMDDQLLVRHTDTNYIPTSTMLVMYNIWVSGEMFAAGQKGTARTWAQDVDWFYYAKDVNLTHDDIEGFVNQYKTQQIHKRDTLPPAEPAP